jgi:hypothetical protein
MRHFHKAIILMAQKTLWLHWDGLSSLFGTCNQMMEPVDSIIGVQARLKWLGFYDGPIDDQLNDKTKEAIKLFKVFPEKIVTEGDAPTTDDVDDLFLQKLDGLYEYKTGKRAIGSSAIVELPDNYHAAVNPNEGGEHAVGITLVLEPLAVRIEAVPKQFKPFEEFAGIKVKLTKYERIQTLLFRVYHSYDQGTDATTVPPINHDEKPDDNRIVYQEVLNRSEIEQLWDENPGGKYFSKNVAKYSAETAKILRAKRYHTSEYISAEKGSFKFKIWVSTEPEAFNEFVDATVLAREMLLEFEALQNSEFVRTPADLKYLVDRIKEDRTADTSDDIDPEININSLVHDQSVHNPNGLFADWKNVWTSKTNKLGRNLIQPVCTQHNTQFFIDNEQIDERFASATHAESFLKDPVGIYMDLWRRAKAAPDGNFAFPELADVVTNIKRHINRIRQRLCCGPYSAISADLKKEIKNGLNKVDSIVAQTESDGYKYHDCLILTVKFVGIWHWIVLHAIVRPELEHYQLAANIDYDNENESREQMNQLSACRTRYFAGLNDPTAEFKSEHPGNYFENSKLEDILDINKSPMKDSIIIDKILGRASRTGSPLPRELILLPSFNPLDEIYFTRIKQVPIFLQGIIDLKYLDADAHKYTPWEFLQHDTGHTFQFGKLWISYSLRIKELSIDGFENEARVQEILDTWNVNAQLLRAGNDEIRGNEDLSRAFDIVLFSLMHEVFQFAGSYDFPSFPEKKTILLRAVEGQLERIEAKYDKFIFPPRTPEIKAKLGRAMELIIEIADTLEDPAVL